MTASSRPGLPADACCCGGGKGRCGWGGLCGAVTLLTPYNGQTRELNSQLGASLGELAREPAILVSNVDTFQGKESDVVVYSCVRSGHGGIGFVKDLRRLNVALTRARHALFIVGNEHSLGSSDDWQALMRDARERGCWCNITSSEAASRPADLLRRIVRTHLDGTPLGHTQATPRALAEVERVGSLPRPPLSANNTTTVQ